ncbi:MAG: hypothetical protein U9O96_07865 [Candidatus Thermoplasmatota archaeon]|nr:hypothetical protein [Candidatus Thermoplasmatota archaeon]
MTKELAYTSQFSEKRPSTNKVVLGHRHRKKFGQLCDTSCLASPSTRSYNSGYTLRADAPPFGTFLPSIATSYMLGTLPEMANLLKGE